jgi:hypothetical protein
MKTKGNPPNYPRCGMVQFMVRLAFYSSIAFALLILSSIVWK